MKKCKHINFREIRRNEAMTKLQETKISIKVKDFIRHACILKDQHYIQ